MIILIMEIIIALGICHFAQNEHPLQSADRTREASGEPSPAPRREKLGWRRGPGRQQLWPLRFGCPDRPDSPRVRGQAGPHKPVHVVAAPESSWQGGAGAGLSLKTDTLHRAGQTEICWCLSFPAQHSDSSHPCMGQWARAAQGNVSPGERGQRGFTPHPDGRQLGLVERLLFWEAGGMAPFHRVTEAGRSWL